MLMAYADGEVDGTALAAVESYLAQDAGAAQRLAIFTATGKTLGGMFSEPMGAPVPQRLIDAVMSSPALQTSDAADATASRRSADILVFDRAVTRKTLRGTSTGLPSWALAAASIAVVAIAIGTYGLSGRQAGQSQASAGEMLGVAVSASGLETAGLALASVLDATASGASTTKDLDGVAATITPAFTFASATNGFCRQYDITVPASVEGATGVACRDKKGAWIIEGQVASKAKSAGDKIVPAGQDSAAAVDAIVERLIEGDVLGPADETGIMGNGWRSVAQPAR